MSHYEVLGVNNNSSGVEITQAYRRLALKYHPDKNNNSEGSKQKFILIAEAYNVLSDMQTRKEYDNSLKNNYSSPTYDNYAQEYAVPPAATIPGFSYYENGTFHFRIQYPSNWVIDDTKDYNPYDERFSQVLGFFSPSKDDSGTLYEKVAIYIKHLPTENIVLDLYTNSQLIELTRRYSNAHDFILLESSKIFLAGSPAFKLEYVFTYKHGKPYIRSMEVGTIKRNKAYHISYEAYSLEFADYLPVIQKMVNSFEIIQ
jgi:hypothetical protein